MRRRRCGRWTGFLWACFLLLWPAGHGLAQQGAEGETGRPAVDGVTPAVRAQLVPVRATELAAEMAGKLVMLEVRDGERFDAGQTLARFDCARQRAERRVAGAKLERARKLHANRDKLNRLQGIAAIEMDLATADLAQARAERALHDVLVNRCTVEAPFAGVVADVHVRAHQYVGEGEPLLAVLDDSAFEVEMLVPSLWLASLEVGQPFRFAIEETGKTYPAALVRLSPRIDPVSQSLKAYGRIEDAPAELRAGMSGRALFPLTQ